MPIKPKDKIEKKERYTIALTPSVHKRAVIQAQKLNMSLSAYIEELIIEDLSNG